MDFFGGGGIASPSITVHFTMYHFYSKGIYYHQTLGIRKSVFFPLEFKLLIFFSFFLFLNES